MNARVDLVIVLPNKLLPKLDDLKKLFYFAQYVGQEFGDDLAE